MKIKHEIPKSCCNFNLNWKIIIMLVKFSTISKEKSICTEWPAIDFYVFLPTKDIVLRKSFNLLPANFQNTVENNNKDDYIQKNIQMLMFDASHEK